MSIVEELEARIDKISDDIELQKDVLRQLEQSKSAVQRQLNSIRDPMARLPLELSSEILLQCALTVFEAHTTLLGVCNAWTEIALATPALWSSIDLDFPGVEIFQLWLERAHNHSLSIYLGDRGVCWTIVAVLNRHAQRLKHLGIYGCSDLSSFDTIGVLPSLETLSVTGVYDEVGAMEPFDINSMLDLLRLTPNVVRCIWEDVSLHGNPDGAQSLQKVPLPHLLSFADGRYGHNPSCVDPLLPYLSLPGLETLSLSLAEGFGSTEFALFLRANSPPLKKLTLVPDEEDDGDLPILLECFNLIPSLVHLKMHIPGDNLLPFLSALAASHFLPHLSSLQLIPTGDFETIPDTVYPYILRALQTRQTQLGYFKLRSYEHSPRPPPDVCDGFRQLVAGGMEILLGADDQDLLRP
ncbi:hypothetical protein C8R46DRAFT_285195 [Mycena filopes]|nr:hypothetical protein C8R46DRAFT_285195 [Mycena filopes]